MPSVLADYRCAVALGYDCEMVGVYTDTNDAGLTHGRLDERVIRYMRDLATIAEGYGARLQFFVQGMTFEHPVDYLAELAKRGHDIDQHTYDHLPLINSDLAELRDQLLRTKALFEERLPTGNVGLRAPGMYRGGLQDHPEVQRVILDSGLKFVSSDYSTRNPDDPANTGFADKNAYMIIKHLQPRWYPTGLLEIPAPGYSDRNFLDGRRGSLDDWIAHITQCIDFAYDMGGLLYAPDLHPDTHSRHDPDLQVIRAIFDHAASKREPVRFCTYREVYGWAKGQG